ncbi:hypothetical protein EOPP23_06380 [Endozoicomonas sp. OPT23]|uniref:hypothetical protein n=1 Tax=Endozoicomonas sp. OPT23 TaxID=2072845 RepID=UPI00129AE544|nr:hypothetical protein [Endozoicomonas sp. OPT23]MRI32613.1 hypothetical protein [Endozoicomonas sp. OPT23]
MALCFNFFVCDFPHRSKKLIKHGDKAPKSIELKTLVIGLYWSLLVKFILTLIDEFECVYLIKRSLCEQGGELIMSVVFLIKIDAFQPSLLCSGSPLLNQQAADMLRVQLHHPDQPAFQPPSGSQISLAGLGVAAYGLCATATPAAARTGRRPCSTLENKHTHVNCRLKRRLL